MTCIVGIVHDGKVLIGADSAGSNGYSISNRKDVKVFKNGDFVIGCTSSFRMIQLLQFMLRPPRRHPDTDVMKFMVTEFAEAVRGCFKAGGFAQTDNNADKGGTFLVGYEGRLFCMQSDFQVAESADGFDACGCGQDVALGVMHSNTHLDPKARVLKSLETAAYFSCGVRGPFVFQEI